VPAGHWAANEFGTQMGPPQQVFTAQNDPLGQLLFVSQGPMTPQLVDPGTHAPPPPATCTQMQSGFELLHDTKDAHVDPAHSGWLEPQVFVVLFVPVKLATDWQLASPQALPAAQQVRFATVPQLV
jgi:hypothetical protein